MVNIPWQVSGKSKGGGGGGANFAIYIRNLSYIALEDVGEIRLHTIGAPLLYGFSGSTTVNGRIFTFHEGLYSSRI